MSSIHFAGEALSNEKFMGRTSAIQKDMHSTSTQISTDKKYQHLYDMRQESLGIALSQADLVKKHQQNSAMLDEVMFKSNEASEQLDKIQKYIAQQSRDWNTIDPKESRAGVDLRSFGTEMLQALSSMLNAKSNYDQTYMFSGQDTNTAPVDLNDATDFYKGSAEKLYFTYEGQKIEFSFLANNKFQQNDLVQKLKDLSTGIGDVSETDITNLSTALDATAKDLISQKRAFDEKVKEIKALQDQEKERKEQSIEVYNTQTKLSEVERAEKTVDMMKQGQKLQALFKCFQIISSSNFINFMR